MTTRLALLSDIHGNLPALQAVLADLDRRTVEQPFDASYCLGDLGGYGAQPNEVQESIMERRFPTIAGNYDQNVGFGGPDCGCHYIKPLDIAMSDISFGWTKERTSEENAVTVPALAEADSPSVVSLGRPLRAHLGVMVECAHTSAPADPECIGAL